MKPPIKSTEKSAALLLGADALDLYLDKINRNLRTMMGQADILETLVLEMEEQQRGHIAPEPTAAHPNNAQGADHTPANDKEYIEVKATNDGKTSS